MLNPSTIEKAEAKLNPVAAANRKPKKPVPVHTVHGAGAPKDGVPLSELRDFFLAQPSSLDLKRSRRRPLAISQPSAKPSTHNDPRSDEHTSDIKPLLRISYAVYCLKISTSSPF